MSPSEPSLFKLQDGRGCIAMLASAGLKTSTSMQWYSCKDCSNRNQASLAANAGICGLSGPSILASTPKSLRSDCIRVSRMQFEECSIYSPDGFK